MSTNDEEKLVGSLPIELRDEALKQVDAINFKKLWINTLSLLIFGSLWWAICHLIPSKLIMSVIPSASFLIPVGVIRRILIDILALVFFLNLIELIDWWQWQRKLEAALKSGVSSASYVIKLTGLGRRAIVSYRNAEYPARHFSDEELFPESTREVRFGHELPASIYFDTRSKRLFDSQRPLAIVTGRTVLLVYPKIIGAWRTLSYFASRSFARD